MSNHIRPPLVVIALEMAALALGFPGAAMVVLFTGALVGYLIGSVKGTGAEFSILILGVASIFGSSLFLTTTSFSDQPAVIPIFHYAVDGI